MSAGQPHHGPGPVVAFVMREKTGCRQYPFATVEDLRAWAAKHPYRDERVKVVVCLPDQSAMMVDQYIGATRAADYVQETLNRMALEL